MKPDIGTYYDLAEAVIGMREPSLSYLEFRGSDREEWRTRARAKVFELLAFNPPGVPLNAELTGLREEGGVSIETLSYELPYGPRVEAFFLMPTERTGRLPAVIALHDHGGFKYFGKEKIVAIPGEPEILREFKADCYGGRSWATELARRGYAVLVTDLFLWGSRKVAADSLPDSVSGGLAGLDDDGSRDYIKAYNAFAGGHEHLMAKTLFAAGTTWPGIFTYEDRRSVDYLLSRPEIDPDRIGCCGLSGGGLRTVFLAGLDPRIRCGICVGFMSTFRELLYDHIKGHTWMLYVPHLSRYLDMPDVIALRAPAPLMVQYDNEDVLYTLKGQHDADLKLKAIYDGMGAPERYSGRFYPGPHKFDVQMQEDAFDWFDSWLRS